MPVTNVGKISGQLLKANLTRTSDLLIDNTQATATPTLFIGHTNDRIGIKTDSPTRELLVNGDTKITGDSIQTNSMTVGNLTFNGVTSTVTASVGSINLNSSGSHTFNELRTDNLAFTNSGIRSLNGSDKKPDCPVRLSAVWKLATGFSTWLKLTATELARLFS